MFDDGGVEFLGFSFISYSDEFDFIPVSEPRNNKSPIVLVDHKLGLELWCVKILFQYAYQTLMAWRTKKSPKFIGKIHLQY